MHLALRERLGKCMLDIRTAKRAAFALRHTMYRLIMGSSPLGPHERQLMDDYASSAGRVRYWEGEVRSLREHATKLANAPAQQQQGNNDHSSFGPCGDVKSPIEKKLAQLESCKKALREAVGKESDHIVTDATRDASSERAPPDQSEGTCVPLDHDALRPSEQEVYRLNRDPTDVTDLSIGDVIDEIRQNMGGDEEEEEESDEEPPTS